MLLQKLTESRATTEANGIKSWSQNVNVTMARGEEGAQVLANVTVKTNANATIPEEVKALEATDMSETVQAMIDQYAGQIKAVLQGLQAQPATE